MASYDLMGKYKQSLAAGGKRKRPKGTSAVADVTGTLKEASTVSVAQAALTPASVAEGTHPSAPLYISPNSTRPTNAADP